MAKTRSPNQLGRSLLAGECTIEELRTLTRKFGSTKHYLTDELASYANDSVIVDGNLVIDGDFDTSAHRICRLVVTGDLKVGGLYRDHDDPQTAVYVLGDFEAQRAITAGALGVAGNVYVTETLVGYYNDHAAEIHGHVTATTFVPENHFFSIGSVLGCDHLVGRNAQHHIKLKDKRAKHTPIVDEALRALLVPEVVEVIDEHDPALIEITLDHAALRDRVAKGLPILRAAATPTPKKSNATAKPAPKRKAATSTDRKAVTATKREAAKPAGKARSATKRRAATKSKRR